MTVELAKFLTGLTFGQLLLKDAAQAKKLIECPLSTWCQRVSVVSVAGNTDDKKFLELAKVGIFWSEAYALMHSGTIPNVILKNLCKRLSLTPKESNGRTTAKGVTPPVYGIRKDVPISFDHVVEPIDFLMI